MTPRAVLVRIAGTLAALFVLAWFGGYFVGLAVRGWYYLFRR